jgi:hypothetical protein
MTDLTERLEVTQPETPGLPAFHREADDRPVLAASDRPVLPVDHRDADRR